MNVHRLSRADARRIAVRAQLLDNERPTGLLDVVRRLTFLQVDPTAAIAPNADLVAWSRLGSSYDVAELRRALDERVLVELAATIRPSEDIALYRADMADWPGRGELRGWQRDNRAWVEANGGCRRDILARLEAEGPLASREFADTCAVPWASTGWTGNKNVIRLLDFMEARGEVAIAGRQGRERLWDLASRVHPDVPALPAEEALRERNAKRLRALGIARTRNPATGPEPWDVGEAGEPAVVEGVRGEWRVEPSLLDGALSGRAALLSPFDRLIHDRKRTMELFEFDYGLEMYKPAANRRWGYFALPVLYGDRMVGKLDAIADRKAGVLRVHALHWDVETTSAMVGDVRREIEDLARWLELDLELPASVSGLQGLLIQRSVDPQGTY